MPVVIDGITYFSGSELASEVCISRQTLWRWRREGSVPVGHRHRSGKIVFTSAEAAAVRQYANRIEPIVSCEEDQLRLFDT